jgi:hypothetical protein
MTAISRCPGDRQIVFSCITESKHFFLIAFRNGDPRRFDAASPKSGLDGASIRNRCSYGVVLRSKATLEKDISVCSGFVSRVTLIVGALEKRHEQGWNFH